MHKIRLGEAECVSASASGAEFWYSSHPLCLGQRFLETHEVWALYILYMLKYCRSYLVCKVQNYYIKTLNEWEHQMWSLYSVKEWIYQWYITLIVWRKVSKPVTHISTSVNSEIYHFSFWKSTVDRQTDGLQCSKLPKSGVKNSMKN